MSTVRFLVAFALVSMGFGARAAGDVGPYSVSYLTAKDVGYIVSFVENQKGWCPSGWGFYIAENNPHAKEMYATLLAADLASRKVVVYVADVCTSSGLQLITSVGLAPQ